MIHSSETWGSILNAKAADGENGSQLILLRIIKAFWKNTWKSMRVWVSRIRAFRSVMARNSFDGFVWFTMDTILIVILIMSTRSLE